MVTKINTLKKDDDFESRSLKIVRQMLQDSQISHLPDQVKIYNRKQKGYYSSMRKKEIFFDLTIEIWPPGAKRYTLIYFIECKNYDKSVPVDDIEEFHKKIEQVSGANAKGIIITNAPLQEGAFNYAESAGMMVVQGESSEDFKIILHKTNNNSDNGRISFVELKTKMHKINPEIIHIEKIIDNAIIKAFTDIISDSHISYGIDKLTKYNIQNIANEELGKIDPLILSRGYPINPNKLREYLQNKLDIKISSFSKPENILGYCNIENSEIGLNSTLVGKNRELFILSHEFGHFKLHQKLKLGQNVYDNFQDPQYNFRTGKYDLSNPKNWIEWQANYFASSLVLPRIVFRARLFWCQQRLNLKEGIVYLDDQPQNRRDFVNLIKQMAYICHTSQTSIVYRLKEFKLLDNKSRLKSIGQVIEDFVDGYLI